VREEFKHLQIQQALYVAEELQSLAHVQAVNCRRTPLDGRPFPVKQPRVVRQLEANVRFIQVVPGRPWRRAVVPNIPFSEREI
jgi:hypothetical protein